MISWIHLITLAFAVSLDSFGVGLTYGMRKVKIPIRSLLLITICSGVTLVLAMAFGKLIGTIFSQNLSETIGGLILILVGAYVLLQVFKPEKSRQATQAQDPYIFKMEIRSLGIVIQILKKPMVADIDKSGTITGMEAVLLGLALSLDAFGAGVGAALMGFTPILTALVVALTSCVFLLLGMNFGFIFSKLSIMKHISYFPGILLIILGVLKL